MLFQDTRAAQWVQSQWPAESNSQGYVNPPSAKSQRSPEYERQVMEQRQNSITSPDRPTSASTEISTLPELTKMAMGGNEFVSVEYCDPPFW